MGLYLMKIALKKYIKFNSYLQKVWQFGVFVVKLKESEVMIWDYIQEEANKLVEILNSSDEYKL